MERWRPDERGRRRAVFALAVLAHAVLVGGMLAARVRIDRSPRDTNVEATIVALPLPAPTPPRAIVAAALPHPTRLRALPNRLVEPNAIAAPPLSPQAASEAAPPASAASEPLRLTLSRDQLRALIAGTRPTLAQSLARGPAPSALSRIGGDDTYSEKALPNGETEVHVHGSCFKMVPTPASRYDPYNHGGALQAACD